MFEKFLKIFVEVGQENGKENWFEIFDSELFEEVERRIGIMLGWTERGEELETKLIDNIPEFSEWYSEMAGEL